MPVTGTGVGVRQVAALTWSQVGTPAATELVATLERLELAPMLALNSTVLSPHGFAVRPADPGRTGCVCGAAESGMKRNGVQDRFGRDPEWVVIPDGPLLGQGELRKLRQFAFVTVDERSRPTPFEAGALVVSLCLSGVPVATTGLSRVVRALVDGALLELTDMISPQEVSDPGRREALSLRIRRRAHEVYGYRVVTDPPHPDVSVVVDHEATHDDHHLRRVLAEVAAQAWPALHVHLVTHPPGHSPELSDTGPEFRTMEDVVSAAPRGPRSLSVTTPSGLADDVRSVGSIYLARMGAGLRYGPHHLEDLVRALGHSGAAVVHSPSRFEIQGEHGMIMEHCDEVGEALGDPGLKGGSLWYAGDGPETPQTAGYRIHGCNALPLAGAGPQVTDRRTGGSILHRTRPTQLDWLPLAAVLDSRVPASYFARLTVAARS